jgi:hypothetical protein
MVYDFFHCFHDLILDMPALKLQDDLRPSCIHPHQITNHYLDNRSPCITSNTIRVHFRSDVHQVLTVVMWLRVQSETSAVHSLTRIGGGEARAFVVLGRVELRAPNARLSTVHSSSQLTTQPTKWNTSDATSMSLCERKNAHQNDNEQANMTPVLNYLSA